MAEAKTKTKTKELTIEDKLKALFRLQIVDSEIDKIKVLRGELPLEVQDLEDEVAGLETRIQNLKEDVESSEKMVNAKQIEIKESQSLIKKYQDQQNNVRNNREFDALSKEIEFQTLEIELCEKRIREFTQEAKEKADAVEQTLAIMEERKGDLESKKNELNDIIKDTQNEEEKMLTESKEIATIVEPRLISAYKKIRENARNGLAVVSVQRDACGGCFNKIPPQRQLDIRSRRKIIVCEYCGRILVDPDMAEQLIKEKTKK